ncbi:MAG: extracellular solute-binding protein [Enterococcus sp.]|nr:extracellular solute-binding protein [Enterococcus sp.]
MATITLGALSACGQQGDASEEAQQTVTLWAGGSDNVKVGMEQIVKAFNASEKGEEYQLKLEFIMSGSGSQSLSDRIIAAKKAGESNTDYDLILVSDAEVGVYLQEGGEDIFVPYEETQIPNVQTKVSSGEGVLVPYRGTTVVLAYNSENVSSVPETAAELYQWIEDNPGRFAYNTPGSGGAGSSFVQTVLYNELPEEALTSSDAKWKAEWLKGFERLKSLHSSMYQTGGQTIYPNKNQGTLDLLINQEVDMIPAWADMVITNLANGTLPENIKMTQVEPGFTGNVDGLAIPSIGSNIDGAQAVMDFMLTTQAQQILLDTMAAIPVIDSSLISSDNSIYLKDLKIDSFRTSSLGTLANELNEEWDQTIGTMGQ